MKVTLDQKTIQLINIFRNLTGSNIIDCVDEDEDIYFVVAEGQYGLAVGKSGMKIKNAEKVLKKNIKVFEYSTDLETFIKNVIPETNEININDEESGKVIFIKVKQNLKAKVIGKGGKNIKVINEILHRLFDVESLKIK
ncbi:NusA-like transcription termination signal-binding factor [Candidatus Aenigmatarchaeota archaeon]